MSEADVYQRLRALEDDVRAIKARLGIRDPSETQTVSLRQPIIHYGVSPVPCRTDRAPTPPSGGSGVPSMIHSYGEVEAD